MFGEFMLANGWFAAMDSGVEQDVTFNEAVSLLVDCKDQAEIDTFWDKLSSDTQFEQCGWFKDKICLSWQIVPENMGELMERPNAFANMMVMKKIVIADFFERLNWLQREVSWAILKVGCSLLLVGFAFLTGRFAPTNLNITKISVVRSQKSL